MNAQEIENFFTDEVLKALNSEKFKRKLAKCWQKLPQCNKNMLLEATGYNETEAIKALAAFMMKICPPDFSKLKEI